MSSGYLKRAFHYLLNFPGWHTNRKIVIIQSDDWGSIRMPSAEVRSVLSKHPLINADDAYCRYDTLESAKDLECLFETLHSVKDAHGKPAVLTANFLMANPDFDKIRENDFSKYCSERFDTTYNKYQNEKALSVLKSGIKNEIFHPQFHGKEHVNIDFWMRHLKNNHSGVKFAFDHNVFAVNFLDLGLRKSNFQAAWDFDTGSQEGNIISGIEKGLGMFSEFFGYSSQTAIAPAYVWSENQEKSLFRSGVRSMQGIPFQLIPSASLNYSRKFRSTSFNTNRMSFQIRNAFFEPSLEPKVDSVNNCLRRIQIAFQMNKPAIIGSHRLNYIGGMEEQNRTKNLDLLANLLKEIVKNWPDVEFRSSDKLFEN